MPILKTVEEVDAWLTGAGWHPGRDVGDQAVAEAVTKVVDQYRAQGLELTPSAPALAFLREYLDLKALIGTEPEEFAVFTPWLTNAGDAEELAELAGHLGTELFPVALDTFDGAVVLVDPSDRFFYMHWSGNYYLGQGKYGGIIGWQSADYEDAEDYYV
ncbi:SUKH-3 domain-containing protein [Streptomyces sp. NPDC006798]|uniref:SUKH-3 domain-containing protein n=1 Tax=Streptomyces sp. NPDC006798 TaxID=3155462 RepID=UPI003401EBFC